MSDQPKREDCADLSGGLDLLGDWLDAKGYTEEAGLCTRVMDHMHKQADAMLTMEAHIQRNEQHIHDLRLNVVALEAALEERHKQHLKLELEKRAVEDIAEQFSKDKAEYYRHILRLEAALKPFAKALDFYWSDTSDDYLWSDDEELTMADLRAARAAMEGK